MTRLSRRQSSKRPLWQFIAPMLLISLALHGAFLLIPVASSDDEVLPPPDPEQDNIAITRIPPTTPTAAATPAPATGQPARGGQAAKSLAATNSSSRATGTTARTGQASQSSAQNTASTPGGQAQQRHSNVPSAPIADLSATGGNNAATNNSANSAANNPAISNPSASNSEAGDTASAAAAARNTPAVTPPNPGVPLPVTSPRPFDPVTYQRLLAYAQTLTRPAQQINQLAQTLGQRYAYSPENTGGEVYGQNLNQWLETVRAATGQPDLWNESLEPNLVLQSRQRVCLDPPPQEAAVGLVVSPTGQLQGEPTLLQSTGYPFLNAAILETVKMQTFPRAAEQKAYVWKVNIDIDYGEPACLKPYPRPTASPDAPQA